MYRFIFYFNDNTAKLKGKKMHSKIATIECNFSSLSNLTKYRKTNNNNNVP